jgi:hypothetical protein
MVTLQHRHYVCIAAIIADIESPSLRAQIASRFAHGLRGTNPNYSFDRFYRAANGDAVNWRDRVSTPARRVFGAVAAE